MQLRAVVDAAPRQHLREERGHGRPPRGPDLGRRPVPASALVRSPTRPWSRGAARSRGGWRAARARRPPASAPAGPGLLPWPCRDSRSEGHAAAPAQSPASAPAPGCGREPWLRAPAVSAARGSRIYRGASSGGGAAAGPEYPALPPLLTQLHRTAGRCLSAAGPEEDPPHHHRPQGANPAQVSRQMPLHQLLWGKIGHGGDVQTFLLFCDLFCGALHHCKKGVF